ncbi:MAG: DUF4893 domain-containing protein [Akkermansiaceae bacterium]|nr:DUF4893 domain-containing protein [Akkermansiaceae bacterium]
MKTTILLATLAVYCSLIPANAREILSSLRPAEAKALAAAEEGLKKETTARLGSASATTVAGAKEILALLAKPRIAPGKNVALNGKWKVRSCQVNQTGVYCYPFLPCEFRMETETSINLIKNTGSQRRMGVIGDDGKGNLMFIGAKYYQGEPPGAYSGFQAEGVKTKPERDSYGYLYRLGKDHLILIFGETVYGREIYEFKKN